MNKITEQNLNPAFQEMIKCGLSKEKAYQEIGFALSQINAKDSLTSANIALLNNAVAQVAYTGLSLNHLKQEAVISDYNEQKKKGAWFLPMYRGLLKIAIEEEAIMGANTQVINEGDEYEVNAASFKNPVKHIVKSFNKDRKPVVTYTVLMLPNQIESLTLFYEDEYDLIKPKGGNFSPHTNWADEMRKKSCLKRALKTVSSTKDSKLNHLIALDNLTYDTEPIKDHEPTVNVNPVFDKDQYRLHNATIQYYINKGYSTEKIINQMKKKYSAVSDDVKELINNMKPIENVETA